MLRWFESTRAHQKDRIFPVEGPVLFCLQKVRRAARRKPDLPCGRSGFCRGAAGIRRRNNLRSGASGPSGPHGRDSGGCSGRRPDRRKPCRPGWRSGPGPGRHRPGPDPFRQHKRACCISTRSYLFDMRLHTFFLWAAGHRACRCSGARRRCSMAHRASAPSRTWLWGSR